MIIFLWHELFQDKIRLFLTFLSVFIGTLVVVIMLSFGNALFVSFMKMVESGGINVVEFSMDHIINRQFNNLQNKKLFFTQKDILALHSIPYVKDVTGVYRKIESLQFQKHNRRQIVMGVDPIYFQVKHILLKNGRLINLYDIKKRNRVLILGYRLEEEFFNSQKAIGKYILVHGLPFLVIGVTKPSFHLANMDSRDAYIAWIPSSTYFVMFWPKSYNVIFCINRMILFSHDLGIFVNKLIGYLHGFKPHDFGIIHIRDHAQIQRNVSFFMAGFEIFLSIIGSITLFLSGLSVMIAIFLSVQENMRYIGVQMALGATPTHILWQYLLEGIVTIFFSGVLSILCAFFILKILNIILQNNAHYLPFLSQLHLILSTNLIIIIIFLLAFVSFFVSLVPAKKAASILPAEALRCE